VEVGKCGCGGRLGVNTLDDSRRNEMKFLHVAEKYSAAFLPGQNKGEGKTNV